MADTAGTPSDETPTPARMITPAVRQRLEAVHARAKACLERGDHDYAHDLLTQCIAEDPGSLVYAQTFRANIKARFGATGKKSSRFSALVNMTGRGPVAKAAAKGDWQECYTAACLALKKNPVDKPVLREMAAGCGVLGHTDTQLFYLRWALDIDLHDVETNRAAAAALAGTRQYDQAIACWQRVVKQKPGDEEAARAISRLSVEQTIHQGGYDPNLLRGQAIDGGAPEMPAVRVADLAAKDNSGAPKSAGEQTQPAVKLNEEDLADRVAADSGDLEAAAALGEIYATHDRPSEALKVVRSALRASSDPEQSDHAKLEDLQLRIARLQADAAQRAARDRQSEEARDAAKRQLIEANQAELEVYAARAERTPSDARSQFQLGLRLKRAGKHRDAIMAFQAARSDARSLADTQLHLGECFQHIQQFKLAGGSYEAAVAASREAGGETYKLALYRSGVLATGLGDLDRAEARLTELAGIDFGYRDVGDRLDKIAELRKNA